MATTKYELLCRYYNVDMKMPITNIVDETWISSFDKETYVKTKSDKFYSEETFEFGITADAAQERKIQDLLIYGNNSANPKFNMFFIYKARDIVYSESGTVNYPYALKDRMERIPLSPWFIHSTHSSLNSAMAKARILANIVGHDNIKIGKIVPLDQYIEIV